MSFLSTLVKGVGGFIAGGPVGAAAAIFAPGGRGPTLQVPDSVRTTTRITPFTSERTSTSYFGPQMPDVSYGGGQVQVMGGGCPTGFRLNRSRYVTRGGGTSRWPQSLQLHEKGTVCVRRRKLNPGNGKAATRAVRRLVAFYRLSNRVAKQLRRAAAGAKLGRRRGQRFLPRGGGAVTVVDTD